MSIRKLVVLAVVFVMSDVSSSFAYQHPTLGRFVQRDPIGYADGMSLYEQVRSAPTSYSDPLGTEIFVYPSSQVTATGPMVALALQKIVGDCAKITTTEFWTFKRDPNAPPRTKPPQGGIPGVTMRHALAENRHWIKTIDYWRISYSDEKGKCACDDCWKLLKEAIDETQNINVYLQDTGKDGQPLTTYGGGAMWPVGGITNEALAYVDYSYLTGTGLYLPLEEGGYELVPWEITLWHEAILHGGNWIDNRPHGHPGRRGVAPAYDPIVKLENKARLCWNKNNPDNPVRGRRHQYW